jgi:hypothetical protein
MQRNERFSEVPASGSCLATCVTYYELEVKEAVTMHKILTSVGTDHSERTLSLQALSEGNTLHKDLLWKDDVANHILKTDHVGRKVEIYPLL